MIAGMENKITIEKLPLSRGLREVRANVLSVFTEVSKEQNVLNVMRLLIQLFT